MKDTWLGVRPESIALSHVEEPGAIPAWIDLVEPMGSVNHIVLRFDGVDEVTVDGEPCSAVTRSNEEFAPGSRTWLSLRPDRLVLFESGTGEALAVLSPNREWQAPS